MNVEQSVRKFVHYFSAKSKIERQEKIIAYRTKKYADFSDKQLQLKINDLETKEKTAKSFSTVLNVALFSAVAGVAVYVFRQFSLWMLDMYHLNSEKGIPMEAVQFSKLVDIGLGGLILLVMLLFWLWYNHNRNERVRLLRALKDQLGKDQNHEL